MISLPSVNYNVDPPLSTSAHSSSNPSWHIIPNKQDIPPLNTSSSSNMHNPIIVHSSAVQSKPTVCVLALVTPSTSSKLKKRGKKKEILESDLIPTQNKQSKNHSKGDESFVPNMSTGDSEMGHDYSIPSPLSFDLKNKMPEESPKSDVPLSTKWLSEMFGEVFKNQSLASAQASKTAAAVEAISKIVKKTYSNVEDICTKLFIPSFSKACEQIRYSCTAKNAGGAEHDFVRKHWIQNRRMALQQMPEEARDTVIDDKRADDAANSPSKSGGTQLLDPQASFV
ncbi:uncharacterized protein MELLADRAFT_61516 [Melampsora larici-populina 98AG31]|uniref:Uncharacterized protein n=1 Tax=Melampsora larici-populina (strain 98AG31 / pathotype 3-4-7) TaxID=747676 RepID=F4RF82_MELLP|nr:uncharacterized protein MELLADRAFT_61516 [Melampsora larici-populina 98AG31]EGG08766.1 hypothetical protein MELLADRAFT_61516 [Melampsora larici-populina 98AG31]